MSQGVKGSAHWAQVPCPQCDAPLFERCERPDGTKASHPHKPRLARAARSKPRSPLPGYTAAVREDGLVFVEYEDSLLPVDIERAAKAALRIARKAHGAAARVRQADERAPIDWATAQPRGALFRIAL